MIKTVIVVPCFNEANRLAPEAFRDFARDWRHGLFLFVDDGSTDTTFTILAALQKSMPTYSAVLASGASVFRLSGARLTFASISFIRSCP
jgi:glycosyltransferase involved in cell wall biosynthesis